MRRHWKKMGFVAAMMAVLAVTDVILPLMTRHAIDHYITPEGLSSPLWPFGLAYLGIILAQVGSVFLFILVAARVEHHVNYDMRMKGFRTLQELSFSYYDRTSVGYLMSRLTSYTNNLAEAFGWGLVDLVWAVIFRIAVTIAKLVINWQLALMVIAVVPGLAVITAWFQKHILKAQREVRKINSRITGAFNEGIMGAKKKPQDVLGLGDIGADASRAGSAGSKTEVKALNAPPSRGDTQKIEDDGSAAEKVVAFLIERKLV